MRGARVVDADRSREGSKMRWFSARVLRLVFLLMLTSVGQGTTASESKWVQFETDPETITYDLTTIQMIEPSKFTIISMSVDRPDVMRLELSVLDTLRSYCTRPGGKYPAPLDLFMLGKPDMPVEMIEVNTNQTDRRGTKFKDVNWSLPYSKLAVSDKTGLVEKISFFYCEGPSVGSIDEEYTRRRSLIMNGIFAKELYDCKRGVMGLFVNNDDPLSKAITSTHIRGLYLQAYLRLCQIITGEMPYIPR